MVRIRNFSEWVLAELIMQRVWLATVLVATVGCTQLAPPPRLLSDEGIVYGDANWRRLVQDSYAFVGGSPEDFEPWLNQQWSRVTGKSLDDWLAFQSKELASAPDEGTRRKAIASIGQDLHRIVKGAVTKFSLERGYEFAWMQSRGERQCLLQSVLISSMIEKLGIHAGIAMVWKSQDGRESNLGHVVSFIDLPAGGHLIIDASEPEPIGRPQGILALVPSMGGVRFVEPSYGADGSITKARDVGKGSGWQPDDLEFLPRVYVESQFLFYRAERVPGGLLAEKPTAAGLAASEKWMRAAALRCPSNPLAVYSLGRVLWRRKDRAGAIQWATEGKERYREAGYVPRGVEEFLSAVRSAPNP